MKLIATLGACCLVAFSNSFAADAGGTAKDAEALVQKGIKHIAAVGKEKAYADFSTPSWIDRDVYLTITAFDGKVLAHATNSKLVGKDMIGLQDVDGVAFVVKMIEVAKSPGKGWVDYKFTDPTTKKVAPKSAYCERSGDSTVCAGFYKR